MIEKLRRVGVDAADLRVQTHLYWEQRAVVRIGEDRSGWAEIERGVRQGCILSPDRMGSEVMHIFIQLFLFSFLSTVFFFNLFV